MKIRYISILLLFYVGQSQAQIISNRPDNHTKWNIRLSNVNPSDSTAILELRIEVEKDWQLYAPEQDPDIGPQRMEITFHENETFKLIGESVSSNYIQYMDIHWPGLVICFKGNRGVVRQKIKYLNRNILLAGSIYYSVCSDVVGISHYYRKSFAIYDLDSYNIYSNG